MADYTHMMNLIQGAVIQIRERRPLDQQHDQLEELAAFLGEQRQQILIEKLKVKQLIDEADNLPIG